LFAHSQPTIVDMQQDTPMTSVDTASPQSINPSRRYTYEWYVVILCMLAYVFSYIDRQVLALLVEPIKHDLHLTDLQFSLLHGLAFSLFYAVMGMPIALMADQRSRPLIIAVGIFFWSVATVFCGVSRNFIQMFLARMGVGIGEAALSPATYSMLSDLFPKERLGRAVGVYSVGSFIGGGLAFIIGGYVIDLVQSIDSVNVPFFGELKPWMLTFFIVGIPGLLVALLILLTVRDPERKELQTSVNGQKTSASMRDLFVFLGVHKKTFTFHFLGFSFYAMALFVVLGWAPAFYIRQFGMSATQVGYVLGAIVLIANTSGVFFGGWLTDYLHHKGYSDAPMRAGVMGACALIVPIALFPCVNNLNLSLAILALTMFFVSFPMPTSTAAMQILTPNRMRARVSALFLFVSNLLGLALGSALVAVLTDYLFADESAVGYSMMIVGTTATLLTIILLACGCKPYRQSLAFQEAQSR
jgi:MFS family permease